MKKILLTLVGIVALILLIAAFMPKDFKIEKEIVINKPQSEVFDYLKMVKNAKEWSPWIKKDPDMVSNYKGEDGTVGFINSWSGNRDSGSGEQEITNIIPNQRIDMELRFAKPVKTTNHSYFITEEAEAGKTKVTWGMTGKTPYPYNMICFFMRGKVENDFANGLNDLKAILEKKQSPDANTSTNVPMDNPTDSQNNAPTDTQPNTSPDNNNSVKEN